MVLGGFVKEGLSKHDVTTWLLGPQMIPYMGHGGMLTTN